MNVIYHYFPRFREPIFVAMEQQQSNLCFIYGGNSRFGVAAVQRESDHVRHNWFFRNLILQSFTLATLARVCRYDSVILGDLKFLNSWIYAILARLCGRRVLFWTHGVLEPETGLKWLIRRAYYLLANGLLLYSDYEAGLMRELGFTKTIIIVGNSNFSAADVDKARERKARCRPGRSKDVCYIGRISMAKGLAQFARFAEQHPDRKVLLVGPTAPDCRPSRTQSPNLTFIDPEYDFDRLAAATAGAGTFVMFSAAGLSLFTAMILGKRVMIRKTSPQKPEFHLLNAYGLITQFDDYDDLLAKIDTPALDEAEFEAARTRFLNQNTGAKVAERVLGAFDQLNAQSGAAL